MRWLWRVDYVQTFAIFSISFTEWWRVYTFFTYFQADDLIVMMLADVTEKNAEIQIGGGGHGDPWGEKKKIHNSPCVLMGILPVLWEAKNICDHD